MMKKQMVIINKINKYSDMLNDINLKLNSTPIPSDRTAPSLVAKASVVEEILEDLEYIARAR